MTADIVYLRRDSRNRGLTLGLRQTAEVTADFVYLRLHGKEREHAWDYTDDELEPYLQQVTSGDSLCVLCDDCV
jgi:uncharacterized protein YecE (DUF72 family)